MTGVEHHRACIKDVAIAYDVLGAGTPIVLVHGLSGSRRWWARNVEALARRFRVYVVDLIGFGASRGPRRFVLSEASDYLVRWLDVIRVQRPHVIGHSMGGFIAVDMAADYPDRVDRLVLVNPAVMSYGHGVVGHTAGLLRSGLALPLSFLPVLAYDAARSGPVTLWRAARDLLTADLETKLPSITAPTLIVWGDRDTLVPLEHGRRLARALPSSHIVVVAGAGHIPMWDRPQIFNRAVLEFLSSKNPSSAVPRAPQVRDNTARGGL
ncbi:MAG: alpha/beta hydrolase [Chloroflexota bacterium]